MNELQPIELTAEDKFYIREAGRLKVAIGNQEWKDLYLCGNIKASPCSRHGVVHCGYGVCRRLRGL